MTASWDGGADPATLGGTGKQGALTAVHRHAIRRTTTTTSTTINTFRVGALNDGQAIPTKVRVASANGGVDTIPVKRWTSDDGKGFGPGYLKDFTTGYVDPQQAYKKIRDLARGVPEPRADLRPPEQDQRLPAQVAGACWA